MGYRNRQPSLRSGLVLGVGLGGFVDGIVLHQLVQWHSMLSAQTPPTTMQAMRVNMWADGWFHAGTWTFVLLGVLLLRADALRAVQGERPLPSFAQFTGQLFTGWGLFNVIEGVMDHHLLQLHHVRDIPMHVPEYDWLFLAASAALVGLGWVMMKPRGRR